LSGFTLVEGTRQAIVNTAFVLFRRHGYARVSLEEVARGACVTKKTIYYHFASKDALIEAVLEDQEPMSLAAFQTFADTLEGSPEAIVDALFRDLAFWTGRSGWSGSGYTRLAVELADLPGHPARRIASRHKSALEAHLASLLADAGLHEAGARAREIMLLVEGAAAMMVIHGDGSYVQSAGAAARHLLRRN
jgi:AcrR family transcriptional regulator